nr:thioredoxin family protein [Halapricum desulfuricans]
MQARHPEYENAYPNTSATTGRHMTITLMDFMADWCGPCKTQEPILEDIEEDYPDVEFERIDVDERQDVANEYQVRSLPTLIVENDDGVVERFIGVTQAEDIEDALEKAGA